MFLVKILLYNTLKSSAVGHQKTVLYSDYLPAAEDDDGMTFANFFKIGCDAEFQPQIKGRHYF